MEKKEVRVGKKMSKSEVEQALLENFIALQKVLTNLSVRFDDLSNNINKLLQLFEISARNFAEKYPEGLTEKAAGDIDADFLKKLDSLLDQNKTIAKGIMLMEERVRNKNPQFSPQQPGFQSFPQQMPQQSFQASQGFQPSMQMQQRGMDENTDVYRQRNVPRY